MFTYTWRNETYKRSLTYTWDNTWLTNLQMFHGTRIIIEIKIQKNYKYVALTAR